MSNARRGLNLRGGHTLRDHTPPLWQTLGGCKTTGGHEHDIHLAHSLGHMLELWTKRAYSSTMEDKGFAAGRIDM